MSRPWTKTWLDVVFGMVVMGTVGALIGTILGGSSVPITAGLGSYSAPWSAFSEGVGSC